MTHETENTVCESPVQLLLERGLEGLPEGIAMLLNLAMRHEREKVLSAAPYERTEARRGHANGFKDRTLRTRMGELDLRVPQVRGNVSFYPCVLERGQRSERALAAAVAEMYVNGVSTRKVKVVMEQLCGFEVSSAQVSEASRMLDVELTKWRERPIGCVPAIVLDAMYEKVRVDGNVLSCATLIATGILADGRRTVLGVSVSLSEAEVHWRSFLESLKTRGLHGLRLVVSDDHVGLKAAVRAVFGTLPWQRCQVHLQRNAQSYVTKADLRATVAADIRAVFNAPDRAEAQRLLDLTVAKYETTQSKLAAWMAANIPDGFAVFSLPAQCRRRLRTSNMNEMLNRQVRRRTRVATLFPNEAALLRLVSAVLMEISEEWETGKVYLNMNDTP